MRTNRSFPLCFCRQQDTLSASNWHHAGMQPSHTYANKMSPRARCATTAGHHRWFEELCGTAGLGQKRKGLPCTNCSQNFGKNEAGDGKMTGRQAHGDLSRIRCRRDDSRKPSHANQPNVLAFLKAVRSYSRKRRTASTLTSTFSRLLGTPH
jgi:hypothetical protein